MKSETAKVLHRVAGRPMVEHVLIAARQAGADPSVVVVGVQGSQVQARLEKFDEGGTVLFAEQKKRLGTGDAVMAARAALSRFRGDVLILCGDVPALPASALKTLVKEHRKSGAALTVLTAILDDPQGYGRIVRDGEGRIAAIVEHKDATTEQRRIAEINTGTYCADWKKLLAVLEEIRPNNAQGEYYLTDAVKLLIEKGARASAVVHGDHREAMGVNGRRHLALVGRVMREQVLGRLMDRGVTIIDPDSTFIDATVTVGRDTTIYPGVTLEGETRIGKHCVVHGGTRLRSVRVGNHTVILDGTIAVDSKIGAKCQVGPYCHLRPGTALGDECKVGNFVETKKCSLGKGAKASHLSYLGDAVIGRGVNIGAGTITCNYDGVNKHQTILEDGVFIGSDTQLVAPVTVGRGAYVGAGSTVTENVPNDALAITRVSQRNIEGWAERKRQRMAREKKRRAKAAK